MIAVDVNLLVDATMTSAPTHAAARAWFEESLGGTARVGIPWVCITGFIRIAAQPRAWERPLPVRSAVEIVQEWLAQPCTWTPEPGPRHLELLGSLLAVQPAARVVTDAHIAAIALEHGLEVCSQDRDFARWADLGLRSRNPLTV